MTIIDDIGQVATPDKELPQQQSNKISKVEVSGVGTTTSQFLCIACKGNVDQLNGRCTKCEVKQRLDKCIHYFLITLLLDCNGSIRSFQAPLSVIQTILDDDTISEQIDDNLTEKLLFAEPFTITHNNNTIISIYRD